MVQEKGFIPIKKKNQIVQLYSCKVNNCEVSHSESKESLYSFHSVSVIKLKQKITKSIILKSLKLKKKIFYPSSIFQFSIQNISLLITDKK